jgi:hypothetical protein
MKSIVAVACLCLSLPCMAQSAPATAASGAAKAAPAASAAASDGPPQRGGEARVQRTVSEDESVRIDELRVRGITRRVVVQSKLPGAPAYEIASPGDGRDASQDRRSEGRSLWPVFAF